MYKYFLFLFAFFQLPGHSASSQYFRQKEVDVQNFEEKKERETIVFRNRLDSLFLYGNYKKIIEESEKELPYYLQGICYFNLIAAQFFKGDTLKSYQLVDQKLNKADNAISAADLLTYCYSTSYLNFIEIEPNRHYLMNKIYRIYQMEKITDHSNGKEILTLFIRDQNIRMMFQGHIVYKEIKYPYKNLIKRDSMLALSKKCAKDVYEFYKRKKRLFSPNEIGSVFKVQSLMIMMHDADPDSRQYYLKLLKKAIQDGFYKIESEIDFRINTEIMTKGQEYFHNNQDAIIEKYRKEYNRPNYTFSYF